MLPPEYLAGIAGPLQAIYGQLQAKIEEDIARRIKDASYVTDTASWQVEKLKQLGASQQYIAEQIAKHTGMSVAEVQTAFQAAGIKTCATDEATRKAAIEAGKLGDTGIPLAASPAMQQILAAGMRRTSGTLTGLTRSLAQDASGKLNEYLDSAQLMVQSGAFTQQQAVDQTVRSFVGDGVTAFDYATGVATSVEAAVRRALVTGINQTTADVSMANAAELGTDLVEVTSHADARPEHAEWQGKVYSISGKSTKYRKLSEATGYGSGEGLCGWNCRHSFYAFIEGVSEPAPKPGYDPEIYAAEQRQRYNERMIRTWKRKANTLRAGGVDATAADERVAYWQKVQRDHVKKYDLARMYDREKVYGMKAPAATTAVPKPKPTPTPAPAPVKPAEPKPVKPPEPKPTPAPTPTPPVAKPVETPPVTSTPAEARRERPKFVDNREAWSKLSLAGMDKDYQKVVGDRLLYLANEYPIDTQHMIVKTGSSSRTFGYCRTGIEGSLVDGYQYHQELTFSNALMRDEVKADQWLLRDSTARGSKLTKGLATVDHEYAHAIDTQYVLDHNPELMQTVNKFRTRTTAISRDDAVEASRLNSRLRDDKLKLSGQIQTRLQTKYNMSVYEFKAKVKTELGSYAATSTNEFFAEAFANMTQLPATEYTDFMKDFVTEFNTLFRGA